ncbi:LOW QUALITY PROTEIN: uncharacterized protein LOC114800338 [Denticeps clupeoides]|uniref:LOW QUALITY PROTEIN: uncharacterized protein LOC114800338 n=1 Tax=Denticeps clupeoides TaxID=299321 RepID=UPI0010A2DF87|nr:LOW QUALITY PROTEIN: uncharacterized protein LOC114800338 [Denticeps clupeoides]
MEFPQVLLGEPETLAVLALVCPGPRGPDQTPVIIGTNASLFQRLAKLCEGTAGVDVIRSLGINAPITMEGHSRQNHLKRQWKDDEAEAIGSVSWSGPGTLVLPPGGSSHAHCKVDFLTSVLKGDLLLDVSTELNIPAGVLVQSSVTRRSEIDVDSFSVVVQNESLKETVIQEGTVLAQLYPVDSVLPGLVSSETEDKLDPTLFKFGDSPIPSECNQRLSQQLAKRSNVFSVLEWDVGLAKGVEHTIRLSDPKPFRERSRRIAPADIEDVREHLRHLLAAGVIKESHSPYASPIVIARKKNGSVRMCVDYRTLNTRTTPDQYTTPRIDDALDCLAGSKWFTVLDLRSGYYQIAMAEEDKEKTAFICPLGFYQFERMPQGISGAPATFQRLMEKTVGDMNLLQVLVYLDDLIVFGDSLEQHEERLLKVLDRLESARLKVSLDKCVFCQTEVKYVGHIVSKDGIATDPDKVAAVANWPQPIDLKTLRSFLGYYRRFIQNYSAITKPLTELTKGYPPMQKGKTSRKETAGEYFKQSEPFGDQWTVECTHLFNQIKYALTHAPVLAFADPSKPYVLHVDASLQGLGAVLNQDHPEGLRPVAFASRRLNSAEQRYHIHQLEFLALKWSVVDKFHDYLYGARFTVETDNNPLTYVLKSAKLNATGHRWLAALATYDFDVRYRPGRENINADLLSRKHEGREEMQEWQDISRTGVKVICNKSLVRHEHGCEVPLIQQLGATPECVPELYAFPTRLDLNSLELIKAQKQDPVVGAAPLNQIVSSGPMDLVCMDFLTLEPDSKGLGNILVITDHFTRYAQAFATRNQKAGTVARVLVDKYFVHYGLPARIHSDQGRDFESRLIRELTSMMGIKKSRTTPYHPQGDPQPERFNRTLLSMLGTLSADKKQKWSQHLGHVVHAYNSTRNDATGFSPYRLMFGREARLPVDICFGTSPDNHDMVTHSQYVNKLRMSLQEAFQLATAVANKTHQRNKRFNRKQELEQQKQNRSMVVKNHMKFWIKKCKMDLKWIHLVWKCLKNWTFQ